MHTTSKLLCILDGEYPAVALLNRKGAIGL